MTELLFILLLVLLVVLAIVGVFAMTSPYESERQRYARQAREAERKVAEIGRQAQAAILAEALKRAQPRAPDPSAKIREDFTYGPWND